MPSTITSLLVHVGYKIIHNSPLKRFSSSANQRSLFALGFLFGVHCPLQESFRGVEAVGAVLVLLSLFLATSQYDTPDEGAEDESSGKAA